MLVFLPLRQLSCCLCRDKTVNLHPKQTVMKNLIKRILSGVIYIALIVAAILLLDNSPVMYLLVFSLLIVLGIGEMITMNRGLYGSCL